MRVYMYICIYIRMCAFIHMYAYMHTPMNIHIYTCRYPLVHETYIDMHVHGGVERAAVVAIYIYIYIHIFSFTLVA